jgi:nitrogen regulatory protein P-II 2
MAKRRIAPKGRLFMKLVTAIIKPSRLDPVLDALKDAGVAGLTVSEVRGFGRQKGKTEVYRGAEYEVKLLPKVKVEVAAPADRVEGIIEAIANAAKTGKIGDGKVWVTDLDSVLRIRTGEMGQAAIEG